MSETNHVEVAHIRLRSKVDDAWLVHPDLRPSLVKEAADRGTNMTEVALGIIADSVGVTYVPTGRTTTPARDSDIIRLRLPVPIYRALTARFGTRYVAGIRATLCAHYGLAVPEVPKRTRPPAPPVKKPAARKPRAKAAKVTVEPDPKTKPRRRVKS